MTGGTNLPRGGERDITNRTSVYVCRIQRWRMWCAECTCEGARGRQRGGAKVTWKYSDTIRVRMVGNEAMRAALGIMACNILAEQVFLTERTTKALLRPGAKLENDGRAVRNATSEKGATGG